MNNPYNPNDPQSGLCSGCSWPTQDCMCPQRVSVVALSRNREAYEWRKKHERATSWMAWWFGAFIAALASWWVAQDERDAATARATAAEQRADHAEARVPNCVQRIGWFTSGTPVVMDMYCRGEAP